MTTQTTEGEVKHTRPSEWGTPPFRYEMVGDSDGERWGYDHVVYDADGEELTNAPNERVGRLFAAAPALLAELRETADWLDGRAAVLRQLADQPPGVMRKRNEHLRALRDEAARLEGRAAVIRQTILKATAEGR